MRGSVNRYFFYKEISKEFFFTAKIVDPYKLKLKLSPFVEFRFYLILNNTNNLVETYFIPTELAVSKNSCPEATFEKFSWREARRVLQSKHVALPF